MKDKKLILDFNTKRLYWEYFDIPEANDRPVLNFFINLSGLLFACAKLYIWIKLFIVYIISPIFGIL